ncbi:hypothetical protein GWI33_004635 [Rhynchophorus ferrugineus]|uniref:Uncharacterized protein n=1 Tax=Rhynchophorus ferrugineus TaxID=354439 RepID=A0A834IUE3_RHYFE|nr:hypothetical protein GWI33_004635 [Rhynchophorus ferrugineus]
MSTEGGERSGRPKEVLCRATETRREEKADYVKKISQKRYLHSQSFCFERNRALSRGRVVIIDTGFRLSWAEILLRNCKRFFIQAPFFF